MGFLPFEFTYDDFFAPAGGSIFLRFYVFESGLIMGVFFTVAVLTYESYSTEEVFLLAAMDYLCLPVTFCSTWVGL